MPNANKPMTHGEHDLICNARSETINVKLNESKADRENLHQLIEKLFAEVRSAKKWVIGLLTGVCGSLFICVGFLAFNGGFVTDKEYIVHIKEEAQGVKQRELERKEIYQKMMDTMSELNKKISQKADKR